MDFKEKIFLFVKIFLLVLFVSGCGVPKEKYNQALKEKQDLGTKYNELMNEKNNLRKEFDNLLNEKISLRNEFDQLTNEKNSLRKEYDKIVDEKVALRTENDRCREKIKAQEDTINVLKQELENLKKQSKVSPKR